MNPMTSLRIPAFTHRFNSAPVLSFLGKAGRTAKRALDGAAWGGAIGGILGALVGMAMLAAFFYTPFGQLIDQVGAALMILVVISTLGGLAALVFWLARSGLARLFHSSHRLVHYLAALPYFLFWLVPLPLVFAGLGIALACQLYTWAPSAIVYFFTLQGSATVMVFVEAGLGMIAGMILIFRPRRRGAWALALLPAVALNLFVALFALWPGSADYLVVQPYSAALSLPKLSSTGIADPGRTGPFSVQSCTYGSGSDIRRPEFGAGACWTAPTVDAKASLPEYDRASMEYFTWFWGFDFTRLPLNGRVWAPASPNLAPLVLLVHGNHAMGDFSDPGYAYLGEHLASQGFIVVSLDENFLNGFFMKDFEMKEIPVRAWMMLKHLEQWRAWNEDPSHPFFHKVDLTQVAVMGHSRGGETAAMAAVLNRMTPNPLKLQDDFNFGFNIRAVVEIAPSEGSNKINYQDFTLEDTNYLLLQGAHDSDAYMLNGIRQYQRVTIQPGSNLFKSTVYSYRSNHGQFNSVWGYRDQNPAWMLNIQPLLSAIDQQQEAKIFITAFLKAALLGQDVYRQLFQRPWAGSDWLPAAADGAPEDIVLSRYQDDRLTLLQDFEQFEKGTCTLAGASVEAANFSLVDLQPLLTRDPKIQQNNTALHLTWGQPGADYTLNLPQAALPQAPRAVSFALAPADESQLTADLTVQLVDAAGHTAVLVLGSAAALPVLLPAHLVKNEQAASLAGIQRSLVHPAERFLQTITLPLDQFAAAPGFNPAQLTAIHLIFDRTPAGSVLLDEIGLINE